MSLRPKGGRPHRSSGPPAWLIFLVSVALVFGFFYVLQGVQTFFRTGGLGVAEATQRAQIVRSATAVRVTVMATARVFTPMPTGTPIPECSDFRVIVRSAVVRTEPNFDSLPLTGLPEGTIVCVLGRDEGSEWYAIDSDTSTRRREIAYMHETVIEAVNPTPTPSRTPTPLPTVTPAPTDTPSPTVPATRTPSPAPSAEGAEPTETSETTGEIDARPSAPPAIEPTAEPTVPVLQSA